MFCQHVFPERTLWEELPHVNGFLLHHAHESTCQELLIDALRRMSFRKILDLRLRNIDNFLVSLLWETCSLTCDGASERSLSVYVSVPLTALNTWRPSICAPWCVAAGTDTAIDCCSCRQACSGGPLDGCAAPSPRAAVGRLS